MKKRTRFITFRITSEQYEKIVMMAQSKGYIQISDYMRFLALDKNLLIEYKIMENNRLLHKIFEMISDKVK